MRLYRDQQIADHFLKRAAWRESNICDFCNKNVCFALVFPFSPFLLGNILDGGQGVTNATQPCETCPAMETYPTAGRTSSLGHQACSHIFNRCCNFLLTSAFTYSGTTWGSVQYTAAQFETFLWCSVHHIVANNLSKSSWHQTEKLMVWVTY